MNLFRLQNHDYILDVIGLGDITMCLVSRILHKQEECLDYISNN